jgi:hypothetical protein
MNPHSNVKMDFILGRIEYLFSKTPPLSQFSIISIDCHFSSLSRCGDYVRTRTTSVYMTPLFFFSKTLIIRLIKIFIQKIFKILSLVQMTYF